MRAPIGASLVACLAAVSGLSDPAVAASGAAETHARVFSVADQRVAGVVLGPVAPAPGRARTFHGDATLRLRSGAHVGLAATVRFAPKGNRYKYSFRSPAGSHPVVTFAATTKGEPEAVESFKLRVRDSSGPRWSVSGRRRVVVTDYSAELADAVTTALAQSAGPEAALTALRSELASIYDEHSLEDAISIATDSTYSALSAPGALEALDVLDDAAAGRVYSTPVGAAGATPRAAAGAGLCPDNPTESGVVVYYVNGVLNTILDAQNGATALAKSLEREDVEVRLFYNKSGRENRYLRTACGFLGWGAAFLSQAERVSWWKLPSVRAAISAHDSARAACIAGGGAVADFGQSATQFIGEVVGVDVNAGQADGLTNLVTQDVLSGKKVVLVAHSQGNYFARQVILNVASSDPSFLSAIGLVAVASPTPYSGLPSGLASTGLVQLRHDVITCVPGAPAGSDTNAIDARVEHGPCDPREAGIAVTMHDFTGSYLAHSETRDAIVASVRASISSASNSYAVAGQGFLQVTSTWNQSGDVDLHVYEPGDAHVYFGSRIGDVGTLDRDDTVSTGPENYFVCSPSSLVPGPYSIYVNNFGASPGTLVAITIRAGSQVRTLYRVLGGANYSSTPATFVVTVTYHGDANFSFSSLE